MKTFLAAIAVITIAFIIAMVTTFLCDWVELQKYSFWGDEIQENYTHYSFRHILFYFFIILLNVVIDIGIASILENLIKEKPELDEEEEVGG